MYGVVVVFLILQALYTLKLQYSHQVFRLYSASVLFYAAGFILWNLDNHHCPGISYIRSSLPAPLQPATQLHAPALCPSPPHLSQEAGHHLQGLDWSLGHCGQGQGEGIESWKIAS